MRILEEDVLKIVFNILFGLTNALAIFMDLMNRIFHPYLDKFMIIFLNDIPIYLVREVEHTEHLFAILDALRSHLLYANFFKYNF